MQFQLAILALGALALGAPSPEANKQDVTAFTAIPEGKELVLAAAVSDNSAAPAACYNCGPPCRGYYCCDPYPYCGYYTNPFVCVCYR
ncbi:hypothetical protein VHEMI09083 [[Torrubiella] hemipterigena]|uniref:Invertebrate defensins family profile domain-containing protein n=1 Tax=[Torrubiella] hemipterigena TaxID=1531966 RepID=A0A0A1T8Q2_9HYPO|nr:hypothetical protein VHEMI09083 [[Torrubiella] hemipterigena]